MKVSASLDSGEETGLRLLMRVSVTPHTLNHEGVARDERAILQFTNADKVAKTRLQVHAQTSPESSKQSRLALQQTSLLLGKVAVMDWTKLAI
jgi:hypothetical protein